MAINNSQLVFFTSVLFVYIKMIASKRECFCPHCEKYICRNSYYQHKQLYYCETTEQWKTEEISKDFKFSPGDPSKL